MISDDNSIMGSIKSNSSLIIKNLLNVTRMRSIYAIPLQVVTAPYVIISSSSVFLLSAIVVDVTMDPGASTTLMCYTAPGTNYAVAMATASNGGSTPGEFVVASSLYPCWRIMLVASGVV